MRPSGIVGTILMGLALATQTVAGQADITFLVAGKTSNHRQYVDGSTVQLNYHFFAEIFLQPGGKVLHAALSAPLSGGKPVDFVDSGYALEYHGGRYRSEAQLEAAYPDGDYVFQYNTPGTGEVSQLVRLANTGGTGSALPATPLIRLFQGGRPVNADDVNPELDLQVSWSKFAAGGADPNGIMDDLVFVIMADCEGSRRAHSGRPFENTSYLTYADRQFVIEAQQLLPENVYQLSVEHAVLDTSLEHEVVAFATFATTTFLDIQTTGRAPPGEACLAIRRPFDAGQEVL